ncbi:MAG: hypothetical protein ACYCU0_05890 [Solirubrobacteraceae bacterium]
MNGSGDEERGLRERLASGAEDRLGRAFSDFLESPVLSGALGRAFDAREKAAQAQELAMGALNLPSASDVERLTRRLRSVSQRLEGIEDSIARLERSLNARLSAIEAELKERAPAAPSGSPRAASSPQRAPRRSSSPSTSSASSSRGKTAARPGARRKAG